MTAVWAYPWTLHANGVSQELESMAEMGVDAVNLATSYHSIQTVAPRGATGLFDSYRGGVFFEPSGEFDGTELAVPRADVPGTDDSLREVADVAAEHGIDVNSWTVCNHGSRLAAGNPAFRAESVFGEPHDHALCPSRPAVREYFAALVEAVAAYGVDRIDLETIGFPSAFHGHGHRWGHQKNHVFATPVQRCLVSQCFCDGCRRAAEQRGFDIDAIHERVETLVLDSLDSPAAGPGHGFEALRESEPLVADLFDFRAAVVEGLLAELLESAGGSSLNYYVSDGFGLDVDAVAPAGIDLGRLDRYLDGVTAICYTADPDVARDRLDGVLNAFDGTVHAGVSLAPEYVESEADLRSLVAPIDERIDGTLNVYNHSLCGPTQLEWIEGVA